MATRVMRCVGCPNRLKWAWLRPGLGRKLDSRIHVDADDISGIVIHRITKTAVAVFYAGLLDVVEQVGCGRFPAVLFLGHDAGCVVVSESFLGDTLFEGLEG